MAEIDGGALSFTSQMDNSQLNTAIDETLKRVQGMSDAVVGTGESMDKMVGQVRNTISQIGVACEEHETKIAALEDEYKDLGTQMNKAFQNGRDAEAKALRDRQAAVRGEIRVRKELLAELREQSNVLEGEAEKMEKSATATNETTTAHVSLKTRLKELKLEMVEMEAAGQRNTAAYKAVRDEAARLTDAMGDAQAQANILANDQAGFQGVISGLGGLSGGFAAAQGAMALFGTENEALQQTMLKVQALMSITMGLQQIEATLNKDSAFSLVTLNGLKEWWNNLLEVGRGKQEASNAALAAGTVAEEANTVATTANTTAETANTTAEVANATARKGVTGASTAQTGAIAGNTVAQGANTVAATAGTAANIGLAGAFRMVGAAIKSIPVFGWIAAAIGAIIEVVSYFSSKASEAKKKAEEFGKALSEAAYQPIGNIELLSQKWGELGDDMAAKEQFLIENKELFDQLGVSILGVTDAENLLVANKEAFIQAQIDKAKATVYLQEAQDKIKELIAAEAELETMPDNVTRWVTSATGGYTMYYEVHNTAKDECVKKIEELRKEITEGYDRAAQAEKDGLNKLTEAGIEATKTYAAGTLGAIEQAIRLKQEALKNLTNNDDYKAAMAEIEALQKQAAAITGQPLPGSSGGGHRSGGGSSSGGHTSGGGHRSGGGGAKKDPFLEKLAKYKAEYTRFQKWIASGDEILVQSANKEFEKLLKEGATYIDYLKNQRDQLMQIDVSKRTKAQNENLRKLNDAIAEETKSTVLQAFNDELSRSLDGARTAMEMLDIIEERRKKLANDGTDIDNEKSEALDDAEKKVRDKMESDVASLLDEYAGYVAKKRKLEEDFNRDISLLQMKRSKATTEQEIADIDAAILNRTAKYQKDSKTSGNADYDKMLEDYGTFESRKQAIVEDFAEKRKLAEQMGNKEMLAELEKAEKEALSGLAIDEMMKSPDWEKMFGNLDEITTKELQKLIDRINSIDGAYLGIELDPKDLETIKEKIQAMKDEVSERNPFKALVASIKEYGKATGAESKKKALTNAMNAASSSCDLVSGGLKAICDGLQQMGLDADSEAAVIMNDLAGIAEGAGQLAEGIATGNPLSMIQGSISLLTSAFDLFNFKDRKAERSIKKHKEEIDKLSNAYKQLEWQINKALGGEVYENQQAAIKNMQAQQAHLRGMINDEKSKKKTDSGKISEWQEQIAELDRQIADMYDTIAQDITQTTAKDFANELGDALVDAFGKGEDAAESFNNVVNDVLKNAIINQLKKNFLEKQLQSALDGLQNSMGYWQGDNFVFDGLTDAEIAAFRAKVQAASNNFNQALDIYKDLFNDLTDESDTSLTGAVKGVSEETASIIGGQLNAIRINQVAQMDILREHLSALHQIAANTAYNVYLKNINTALTQFLEQSSGDQSLRAFGL